MSDDINLSLHGGAEAFTFKYAKELRDKMTDCEKLIWEVLKEKKLGHKFRRQHPYGKYILDFYCHALRLSVEIDGGVHYEHNQMEYDRFRTKELQRNLITELRFTNDEVKNSIESVLKRIKIEIKKINLSSAPSP